MTIKLGIALAFIAGLLIGWLSGVRDLCTIARSIKADLNECQTALLSMQDDMAALRFYIVKDGGSK